MLSSYEHVYEMIESGKVQQLRDLSPNLLYMLYTDPDLTDAKLAKMLSTSVKDVKQYRDECSLNDTRLMVLQSHKNRKGPMEKTDKSSKAKFLTKEYTDKLPVALTHHLFRNGPVEDMHQEGKLSEDDMKTLNKHMTNQVATLVYMAETGMWSELMLLLKWVGIYGKLWDEPEVDFVSICRMYDPEV